jgi:hypothetical protein
MTRSCKPEPSNGTGALGRIAESAPGSLRQDFSTQAETLDFIEGYAATYLGAHQIDQLHRRVAAAVGSDAASARSDRFVTIPPAASLG